jgi:hypothetical protein
MPSWRPGTPSPPPFGHQLDLLFALPLMGRHTILARLLLHLLTELLCELLDFPTLLGVVVPRVVHQTLGATTVAAGRLMGLLVTSQATTPNCRWVP